MNWTPGPWTIQPDPSAAWDERGIQAAHPYRLHRHITNGAKFDSFSESHGWILDREDGEIICDMRDGERMIANARLISLAPELAEALRHTLARLAAETKDVECCDLYPSTVAAMNEARAILAKLEA